VKTWREKLNFIRSLVGYHPISHPHQTSSTVSTSFADSRDLTSAALSNIMDKNWKVHYRTQLNLTRVHLWLEIVQGRVFIRKLCHDVEHVLILKCGFIR